MNTKQKIFAYVVVGGAVAYFGYTTYKGYKNKKDGQGAITTRPFQVSTLNPIGDKVVTSGRLTNTAQSSQTPSA